MNSIVIKGNYYCFHVGPGYQCMIHSLNQGLENYGSWVKSRYLPVFVNTVVLEHSHAH